jgi:hypothetical protein
MDTGFLNSKDYFGINTRDEDTISWRHTATCSPILRNYNVTSGGGVTRYFYGDDSSLGTKETASYNSTAEQPKDPHYSISSAAVDFHPYQAVGAWGVNSMFLANRTGRSGIMSPWFISGNNLLHANKIYDPVFLTKPDLTRKIHSQPAQIPAYPVSILSCVEEYAVCNPTRQPGLSSCTVYSRQ